MNALAASASFVFAATEAVKTTSCCSSAGNGPTTSRPGAVSQVMRNPPSSASPLATASTICAGAVCTLVLAFIASLMPRLSNTRKTWAPAALAGMVATDCALSNVCFSASDVLMSGFGSTRANCNTEADASNVGCWSGREPSPSGGVLEHLARDDTKVKRSAGREQLDQFGGG